MQLILSLLTLNMKMVLLRRIFSSTRRQTHFPSLRHSTRKRFGQYWWLVLMDTTITDIRFGLNMHRIELCLIQFWIRNQFSMLYICIYNWCKRSYPVGLKFQYLAVIITTWRYWTFHFHAILFFKNWRRHWQICKWLFHVCVGGCLPCVPNSDQERCAGRANHYDDVRRYRKQLWVSEL